ncbi:hypothetical protein OC835_001461 [Tilletia horrida]|nr:hypothetical protein OC835_001461 [Tilletia horrida]
MSARLTKTAREPSGPARVQRAVVSLSRLETLRAPSRGSRPLRPAVLRAGPTPWLQLSRPDQTDPVRCTSLSFVPAGLLSRARAFANQQPPPISSSQYQHSQHQLAGQGYGQGHPNAGVHGQLALPSAAAAAPAVAPVSGASSYGSGSVGPPGSTNL